MSSLFIRYTFGKNSFFKAAINAPLLVIFMGVVVSLLWGALGVVDLSVDIISQFSLFALGLLAFAAGTQFRISRLAAVCPVAFRLSFGGAPMFLLVTGLMAFILMPQFSIAGAFLLAGVLMLNGSAFDRRAIINAPTPAMVKAGVRLESAVILTLGLPIVVLIEGAAMIIPYGTGEHLYPLVRASGMTLSGFAYGGVIGLSVAVIANRFLRGRRDLSLCFALGAAILAFIISSLVGSHGSVAMMATGLIWGEQSKIGYVSRIKLRYGIEYLVIPLAFFLFGFLLVPTIMEANLLMLTFAVAVVTVARVVPRLLVLQRSPLAKEGQVFLAWFGGTPGAASVLYLLTLLDNGNLYYQELILLVASVSILIGVFVARITSRPLTTFYIRGMASAHKRKLYE